mgnify:CR=1 FL=1
MKTLSTSIDITMIALRFDLRASYYLACYHIHPKLNKNPKEKPTQLYIIMREYLDETLKYIIRHTADKPRNSRS